MLTPKEAAAALGLSLSSTYDLLASGRIRHRRVGPRRGKIQVPLAAVEEYLASCEVAGVPPAAPRPARKFVRMPPGVKPNGKPRRFVK